MRRGAIVQLTLLALVIGGIVTAFAVIPNWLPPAASEQADRIHFVFWYVTIICIVIYAIVLAVLLYSAWKFRAAPDDDSDGPPTHGHTGLEIGWTAVPFALVTSMAIVSAVVLARNDRAGDNPLKVDVTAQQFAWTFKYPDSNDLTSNEPVSSSAASRGMSAAPKPAATNPCTTLLSSKRSTKCGSMPSARSWSTTR
jgi:cytochrome c oxidase subunit 2